MKKIGMRIAIVIGVVLAVAAMAQAGDTVVESEGTSFISKNDAVRQAQRAAVEQAVGVFIRSEIETENYVLKKDKILSRTKGYITRFTILSASEISGEHHVKIRATVSLDKIKDDLLAMKILLDSLERPTLMLLIEEVYLKMKPPGMRIAETELASLLQDRGFDLVDSAQLEKARSMDQTRQALSGDTDAAASLGLNFGAQYVVVGKASVEDVGEAVAGTGLRSLQSTLQLKVVQSQSGLLLGSVVRNGVAAHVSPLTGASLSLRKAAGAAADDYLVDRVTDSFQDYLNNGVPLKLHVTGVASFSDYKRVAAAVESIQEVASSKKEGWNKAGGLLVLDLRFKGTSEELAEQLDGWKMGTSAMEVVDFAPDRVECRLRQK